MADANSIPQQIDEIYSCFAALTAVRTMVDDAHTVDTQLTDIQPLLHYLILKLEHTLPPFLTMLETDVLPIYRDMRTASLAIK